MFMFKNPTEYYGYNKKYFSSCHVIIKMFFMNLLKKVKGIIFLIRPDISIAIGICVLVGEILALGNIPTIKEALLGFFAAFFISASAMIVNDFFDLEVDKVNAPYRPLPMKIITGEPTGMPIC